MHSLSVPLFIVSYAAERGIDTAALDAILKPAVPFEEQLARAAASIDAFPDLSSPRLRDELTELAASHK